MSDTNQVSLGYAVEVTPGTIPVGEGATEIKFTGTSDMGITPETDTSALIRSDRQTTDLILLNASVGGSFDSEFMSDVHDEFMFAALQSDAAWTAETILAASGTSVTIDVDNPSGFTQLAETNIDSGATVGDWVEVVQAGVYEYARITTVISGLITVEGVFQNLVDDTNTNIEVTLGRVIENGVTSKTYTIEKAYLDQSPVLYEYVAGAEVATMSISASASSIVSAAFGFVGRSHTLVETSPTLAGSDVAVDGSIYNASSNIATIGEGGTSGLTVVSELALEIDNNLREKNALGVVGAFDVGSGEFGCTGSITTYFENKDMLEKLINNTITSISFGFQDGAGNAIIFELPAVKFSEGVPDVSGKNEDVMLALSFTAFRDTVSGKTLKITRFEA